LVITYVTAGLWDNTGGPSESVPKLLKEISIHNDYEINLITLDGDLSQNVRVLKNYGVNIYLVKLFSRSNIYFNPGYISVLNRIVKKSDIVHIQGLWLFPFWLAGFFARLYKKKLIISPRGSLSPNRLLKSRLKKKLAAFFFDKRNLNKSSAIHCTSKLEEENVKKFGITSNTFVVSNGVDFIDRQHYNKKLINTDKKICLFFSRLDPIKGIEMLINAWEAVVNDHWLLVICGPDERNYRRHLSKLIMKKSLQDKIVILDPVYGSKKYNLYTQSNLFILPSFGENFGISIAESLSCGLPVITTSKTPWEDIVDYNCGWFIDATKEALINTLNEAFMLDDTKLKNMGFNGVKLIIDKYGWENISHKMSSVYKEILNGK
jgi:glycosyltransferase involved in cell wall biosynthesis